jgi:beta-lactamase regulating signal transducer with metallopeptidase domain/tetratricopeptide (TPR) repeat protein
MNEWFDADAPVWRLAGWTMLHFLWVGALVAALGAAVRMACRRAAPGVRYGASLAMLAALALAPAVIAAVLARDPAMWEQLASRKDAANVADSLRESLAAEVAPPAEERVAEGVGEAADPLGEFTVAIPAVVAGNEVTASPSIDAAGDLANAEATVGNPSPSPSLQGRGNEAPLARLVAWLPVLWLAGAPLTFTWLAAGLVGSRRLRSGATELNSGPAFDACLRLSRSLGVVQRVAVATCERVVQPVLVGIVRPVILLPAAALSGWSPEELEMVLVHELAHVRRWDNLVNLGQRIVESVLFFHPCVWLASRQVRRDREECCDALVVRHTQRPEAYASLLVSIAAAVRGRQPAALAAASALGGHPLKARVRRILKLEDETMRVSRGTVGAAAALVLAMLATTVLLPIGGESLADESGQASEGEDIVATRKVYPAEELRAIDVVTWNGLTAKDQDQVHVTIDPLDPGDVDVIAPPHVHDQITEHLEQASAMRVSKGFEKARANNDATTTTSRDSLERAVVEELRARLREEIARISDQIREVDVMKHATLATNWGMGSPLTEVVDEALAKDASALKLNQEIKDLDAQLRERSSVDGFRTDPKFKQLVDEYNELEQKYHRIYSDLVKKARAFAGDYSDDLKHAVVFGADAKMSIYEAQKKRLEKELQVVEARLAEFRALEGNNDPAAGGEVADPTVDEEGQPSDVEAVREDLGAALNSVRQQLQKKLDELSARQSPRGNGALEFELTKLRGDIRKFQEQIRSIDEQLAELEAVKQRALERANSPNALEKSIDDIVEKDPTVNMYREQLFQLELQIQALSASSRNRSNAQLDRLKASLGQLEEMKQAAEDKVREAAKEQLEKMPNEYLRHAIVEYNVKAQYFKKQKEAIAAKLKAAEQKLAEMSTVDPETEMLEQEIKSQQMLIQSLEQKVAAWLEMQKREALSARAAREPRKLSAQMEVQEGRWVSPGEVLMTIEDGQTWVDFPAGVPQEAAKKSLDELRAAGWELEDVEGRWRLNGRKAEEADTNDIVRQLSKPLGERRKLRDVHAAEAMEVYDGGVGLMAEAKYREALAAFNQAIRIEAGNFPEAHLAKGDALKAMRLYAEAANSYSQVLQYDANSSAAYAGRGESYLAISPPAYDLAINDFQNALNLDRDNSAALAGMGRAIVELGQTPKEAVAILDEAISVDPQNARAYRDRGLAYAHLREMDLAVADLKKAIELAAPADFETYSLLARVYQSDGQYRQAIDAYDEAIAAYTRPAPGEPSINLRDYLLRAEARLELADILADADARAKQFEQVLADANAVLAKYEDRFPESAEALFRRGKAERLLERYGDAVDSFSRAIEMVPDGQSIAFLRTAYVWRGICFHRSGLIREAGADFKRVATTYGVRAFEDFKVELDRVRDELARKNEELIDRSARSADDADVQILRDDIASREKLASRLERILVTLEPRYAALILPRQEAADSSGPDAAAETPSRTTLSQAEPRLFAYAKLLGEAPELGVTWSKEFGPDGENVTIRAPQPVQDALALVERCFDDYEKATAAGKEYKLLGRDEEFHRLFRPNDENPLVTMTHSVEAFDELAGYPNAFHDVLMGLAKDPYGPKLPIEAKRIDDGKRLVVTAAQGGQTLLRLALAEDSPVFAAFEQGRVAERAAEAAEEAWESASQDKAVDASRSDSSREDDEPQSPWVWRAADWPADMTPEDKQRVARELAEAGVRVQASQMPDRSRFAFAVQLDPVKGNHPMLVWEEQLVDGKPRKTARVVFEHLATRGADRDAGDLSDYVGDAQVAEDRGGWRTQRLVAPPGMTLDEFNQVAKDLEAAGNKVRVLNVDASPQLEIRTPLVNPKPVWETRIVDGQPRKVLRLVDQPAPYTPAQGDPQPASEHAAGDVNPSPSSSLQRRGNSDFGLVRVIQPALATKSHVTAFLEVQPEFYLRTTGADPFGSSGKWREVLQATARSQLVLGAALARPGISDLAIIKAHAGEEVIWLADELLIHFSDESPILGFMLKSDETPSDDHVKLLNAVVAAFVDVVEAKELPATRGDEAGVGNPAPSPSLRGRGKYHRLAPGDVVLVRALGALPDQPLDGQFEVEEFGTLALGPAYGRVEVEGLTVLEAEAAVTKALAEVLTDPKVQVTLLSRAKSAEGDNPFAAPADETYR